MSIGIQAEILSGLVHLQKTEEASSLPVEPLTITKALQEFSECVRYLKTRRSKGAVINLESEADVQDVVFLMLRPWVHDLVPENPTGKTANRYALGDFFSKSAKTIIEVKFIREKEHGKEIIGELSEDIELYRDHCDHLIFFIFDPDSNIPDGDALKRAITVERMYAGKRLHCQLIIRP